MRENCDGAIEEEYDIPKTYQNILTKYEVGNSVLNASKRQIVAIAKNKVSRTLTYTSFEIGVCVY